MDEMKIKHPIRDAVVGMTVGSGVGQFIARAALSLGVFSGMGAIASIPMTVGLSALSGYLGEKSANWMIGQMRLVDEASEKFADQFEVNTEETVTA